MEILEWERLWGRLFNEREIRWNLDPFKLGEGLRKQVPERSKARWRKQECQVVRLVPDTFPGAQDLEDFQIQGKPPAGLE